MNSPVISVVVVSLTCLATVAHATPPSPSPLMMSDLVRIGDGLYSVDPSATSGNTSGDLSLTIPSTTYATTDIPEQQGGNRRPVKKGVNDVEAVPEPSTGALFGLGLFGLAGAYAMRRRQQRSYAAGHLSGS